MNNPFKRPKWKMKDIKIEIVGGELKFSATICYSERVNPPDNKPREYTVKDIKLLHQIVGLIKQCGTNCWEVEEFFSDREGEEKVSICFDLNFYPMREKINFIHLDFLTSEEIAPEDDIIYRSDMAYVLGRFNGMVW